MAHGHFRHSRINRLINAKRRREEANEVNNGGQTTSNLLGTLDLKQTPIGSSDIIGEPCDPLQNVTCLEDVPDATEVSLSKRQAVEAPQSTHVETIVQVVDTSSRTLWQSVGVAYPMTISDPILGVLTISDSLGLSASAELLIPTPPVNLPATQQRTSATPTPHSKQSAGISSSRKLASSFSHRSTPLAYSSSPTPSTTGSPVTSTAHLSPSVAPTTSSSSIWSSSSTGAYGNGGTGSTTGNVHPPTTSSSQPSSGSGSSSDSSTPKIVGGVIGSVAGLVMIILLLLFILRRRNFFQRKGTGALPSNDTGTREMAERRASNDPLFSPSYFAPAFMKRWRQSTMTTATESTIDSSNASERGFQKISGRKIPPVLTHGGDGFGGGLDGESPTVPDCMIGLSPTSPGGGNPSSVSYGPPLTLPYGNRLDTKYTRESEERNNSPTRPPPIRLPVSSSVNFGTPTTVIPSHVIPQPQCAVPSRQDAVGRSHPSYDGSRGSRFTESLEL